MKKLLTIFSLALLGLGLQAREVKDLKTWEFQFDGQETWREVTIPHDFQMELPWVEKAGGARGFKPMATGWYRTIIQADPSWKGSRVSLEFEGIAMQGDIFVNGKPAGEMDYGYTGGEYDISGLLEYGAGNEILVKASTGNADGSRWYTGGGLFRPVRLIVKNAISIARHGIYVTTPAISESEAKVDLRVTLEGFTLSDDDMEIRSDVFGPDGRKVAGTSMLAPKWNKLKLIETALPEMTVTSPELWDCENPNLYSVRVTLVKDGKELDSAEETFGIRSIEFDKEFGFRLNGRKVFLKGIANHHDLGALGAAAYDGAIERMILTLKEFGFNHIRTSHNPYSESLLRFADKYGILVVDELYDKWNTEGGKCWIGRYPFPESWYSHEREWLMRDRNHPCVIAWSFGNELQVQEAWNGFPGTGDWGVTTFRVMKTFALRFDDTRPFTVAQFPARRGSRYKNDPHYDDEVRAPELACATDFASFNYRFREYASYLSYDPDLNIYQSEATTSELAAPFFGMDRDRMIGLAYWGAIEYWGESDGWPKKGWNFSFFNSAMEPYPQAWLIRSAFKEDEPLVHIGVIDAENSRIEWNQVLSGKTAMSENWNRPKGSRQKVCTFTNADEVELFVGGKSLGIRENVRDDIDRRNVIIWDNVPYGNGSTLTAVARNGGREVARHSLEPAGKARTLKAVVENVAGDLEYVRVYAVDSKGHRVYDRTDKVLFELSGPGEIVAIDNQDHYTDDLFNVNPKAMKDGFVMAIIRRGKEPCTLTATSSGGLKAAKVSISAY